MNPPVIDEELVDMLRFGRVREQWELDLEAGGRRRERVMRARPKEAADWQYVRNVGRRIYDLASGETS